MLLILSLLIVELPDDYRRRWETFVDQTLSETNRKNTLDLVNTPVHMCSIWLLLVNTDASKLKMLNMWCCFPVQVGSGNPRPSSEDDMESPFPKELTLQQVPIHNHTY